MLLALGLLFAPAAGLADSPVRAKRPAVSKPAVSTPADTNKRWQRPGQAPRYVCETEGGSTECTCKGILDCKALIDSGKFFIVSR